MLKMIVMGYGISVLLSFLFIRMGFALDEDRHKAKGDTLTGWFVMMFVPILNVCFTAFAAFSLLIERIEKNNLAESFLKHLFLPRNKIKKK